MAIKMSTVHARRRGVHRDACTNAVLHTLSLRQQFAADLLISIATFTAVGDGDIIISDCHKIYSKAEYTQSRVVCMYNRKSTQMFTRWVRYCSHTPSICMAFNLQF